MNEVIARIDISKPSGRKIVRELEKKKAVEIEYPQPQSINENTYTLDEVFDELDRKLEAYYADK